MFDFEPTLVLLAARYPGFSLLTTSFWFKQVQSQVIQETIVPKEPPPEFEFIADPPSISAFDLDVVKLTAQFVARNGRQFLTQLMQKEQRNYQFDFLRPQHSLFNYFTKLVEQYTKVRLLVVLLCHCCSPMVSCCALHFCPVLHPRRFWFLPKVCWPSWRGRLRIQERFWTR